MRKRLASRINSFLKSSGGGKSVQATETHHSIKSQKSPPIPVSDPPTFLEITTPDKKEVYIGKTFSIKFRTDAHPSYFNNPDAFLAVIDPHLFGSFTGSARVIDGYGIAYFKTRDNVVSETTAKIVLELRPPRYKSLSDSLNVKAIDYPEDADTGKSGDKNTPNVQIHPINENDAYYKENEWSHDTVADVNISHESVDIYINDSNKYLTKLIERAQQYSTQAVESIKNRYREHVGFCAFMIHQNKIEENLPKDDGKEISDEQIEAVKKADLSNACETITGLINDFFQIIITESLDTE